MLDRIRAAWNALRGYAAAADLRASTWAPSSGSANAEVAGAAATVARRARDAVRNDPYASRIVDLWTGNAVGAGITTRWPDAAHTTAWRRWADSTACDAEGRLDLYGLQALADPNMGSDAEWQAAAGGAWQPVRVLLSTPAELVPGLGATSGRAIAVQATIRSGDLAQPPRRGDLLRWAGTTYRVETVEPDPLGLTTRLGLARIS